MHVKDLLWIIFVNRIEKLNQLTNASYARKELRKWKVDLVFVTLHGVTLHKK